MPALHHPHLSYPLNIIILRLYVDGWAIAVVNIYCQMRNVVEGMQRQSGESEVKWERVLNGYNWDMVHSNGETP